MPDLTGLYRYRAQKRFGREPLLVLQVQEKYEVTNSNGYSVDIDRYERWRDGRVEDLNQLVALTKQKVA